MECKNVSLFMHEYLDGDIEAADEQKLRKHLQECEECSEHFRELKRTIAFIQSTSHGSAPANFTEGVMKRLPVERKRAKARRWLQGHPLLTAAAVFFVLMLGGALSSWSNNSEFSVSKQDNVEVKGHTAIVPEGKTVQGDLVVRNGNTRIEGKVNGSVTVINGSNYLASAGEVTGEIRELDQMFEWLWYKMKSTTDNIVHAF
ncbi:anti-sigma factor family protein [Priestia endophytica]|jgi:anti-sigma factor RsiW|uniref:Anti-sigma-W factor RsiW n=1 Tax=Priestia endophytica DSM 13796 TaxID=1121089 RepID=A0A1I6BW38_9BACI|nr:anti-sigma factor [Priestia endophytica]KYG33768.1 anti-sigma factor [Priestia endophytica]MBG9812232.1 anti-sigma W factor [Priestia endophytica]RAS86519.1 anti-sigma factor [Priestia endophytica]SFQ85139.1 Transmembrane transcriptional regulator (anti-sigma factor RsiW) [Priestia endophytica DSM 13796]